MNDSTEPPPLTEREMNQFITLAALPTLERALERLRWLEAELAALKANDPLADYQEQVASIVYAAMRFDREDVTPEWQAGNSHAEYRARQAATEIASMLRCALKAHDPLAEMWRELSEYQPMADADGHGESWRNMCEERTEEAAHAAAWARGASPTASESSWTSRAAAAAARAAARAAESARDAIVAIRRAKEAQP
jgi:hypothetical protein